MESNQNKDLLIDFSRCNLPPFQHQKFGINTLVKNPIFFLGCEMGTGKTLQAIVAAQVLFERKIIDKVIVVCPAAVRDVWFNPDLGELKKHLWIEQAGKVTEFHARNRNWEYGSPGQPQLQWVITNYDFIRSDERRAKLGTFCDQKTLLILDESSAVKNHRAQQTKACIYLRRRCGRVLLMNGTPISHSPIDMFSQGLIMDPRILNCASYFHFRARYAVMGGFNQKQIVNWVNLDDMQKRFAPYILRRLKEDCLDLPKKLESVTLTATLTNDTWHVYKEMRDELVAWLDNATISTASQAVVKVIRLAQITSGFLGGLQDRSHLELNDLDMIEENRPEWVLQSPEEVTGLTSKATEGLQQGVNKGQFEGIREVGREKLTLVLSWLDEQLEIDQNLKLLVWCRFRAELHRLRQSIINDPKYSNVKVGTIWGGQKRQDREIALRLLDPRTMPAGPVVVLGTPASGSMGLNLAGAHTVIYISNDYSLKTRLQSEDRVHRPGQTYPVSYFDVVATGPHGQKTIDHAVIKALRSKEDLATFTTAAWRAVLVEE